MRVTTLLTVSALYLLAGSAFAHTKLQASTPAAGSKLSSPPASITLQFSEATQLTALTIRKDQASDQQLGPLPRDPAAKVTVSVPKLEAGSYVVTWRAIGADNHVMKGELHFSVTGAVGKEHAANHHH
jgi:methionine-rich copper-binding protein CopC